jgi:drug/metabolite transporter (DMT)-like permease
MPSPPVRRRSLGFAACFAASALWGCGFFFGKIALAEMNVGAMVFYRFLFATLALLPLLFSHRSSFNRREWTILLVASGLGVPVQFLLQFYGLSLTTVSHASLMVGMMPVLLAVGAAWFAHERMDGLGWAALVTSSAGAALIAWSGRHPGQPGHASLVGDLFVVASLFIALFWILMNKQLMDGAQGRAIEKRGQRHSPIVVTAYGTVAGSLMLAAIVPIWWGVPPVMHVSWKAWLALLASGVLCTATTTLLWNWGLTQVPASQAGVLLNMEPLIGSLLGILVLNESLGPSAWTGGMMILAAAVTLTTRSKTRVAAGVSAAV